MKLVWTFNSKSVITNMDDSRRNILINYYKYSIQSAKKLGYYTIIYTDSIILFKDIADEIILMNDYQNCLLWDSYKIKVLEERDDDFCLIDGDVILHNRFEEFTTDVVFDTYEILNWKKEYEYTINQLNNIGIKNVIKEWDNQRKPIMNCGILYIKSKLDRMIYVKNWKKYNKFINDNLNKYNIDIDYATAVGAQYLLTLIVNAYNLSHTNLNKDMGDIGKSYKHYFGAMKYRNPMKYTETKTLI
jgi:hypothetical protein